MPSRHPLIEAMTAFAVTCREELKAQGVDYFNLEVSQKSSDAPTVALYFARPNGGGDSVTGRDPQDVLDELIRRVKFNRKQNTLVLPAPAPTQDDDIPF